MIFGFLFSNCGYKVLKPYSKRDSPVIISVKPFRNKTLYPELDWKVTDFIIMELTNWPWIKICQCDEVDYVLSGEILSYRSQIPYTYDIAQNPIEYKLTIEISFSYKKREKDLASIGKERQIENNKNASQIIPRLHDEEIYHLSSYDMGDFKLAELEALERAIKRMTKKAMDQFMGINISCY